MQTGVGEVLRAFCPYKGPISLFQEHWEAAEGFRLGRNLSRCVETGQRGWVRSYGGDVVGVGIAGAGQCVAGGK